MRSNPAADLTPRLDAGGIPHSGQSRTSLMGLGSAFGQRISGRHLAAQRMEAVIVGNDAAFDVLGPRYKDHRR